MLKFILGVLATLVTLFFIASYAMPALVMYLFLTVVMGEPV